MSSPSHDRYESVTSSKSGVRVRHFRAGDSDQVRDLFLVAIANGPGSPRRTALHDNLFHPASLFAYASIFAGLVLVAQSSEFRLLGAALSIGASALFLGYRHILSKSFLMYCNACLKDDLADIARYYKMEPIKPNDREFSPTGASGFWVVESESPDGRGHEIVGCVGLDCYMKDGKIKAELRRMAVSPYHRRRGIAALLVNALVAHARKHGMPAVYLGTTQFQQPAIRMYKRLGWVECRRDYYREGIIKVVLLEFRLDL